MDGIIKIGGGGGGRVGIGDDDICDSMQCNEHPYRSNPSGICALCLQEKLGKLVSSSFPLPIRASTSSSSSSPSFGSDICNTVAGGAAKNGGVSGCGNGGVGSLSFTARPTSTKSGNSSGQYKELYKKNARLPFLFAKKKKKILVNDVSSDRNIVFKRSKSTTTPETKTRRHFLDINGGDEDLISPRRRVGRFWSFLYLSSSSTSKNKDKTKNEEAIVRQGDKCLCTSLSKKSDFAIVEEEEDDGTQAGASFERKVSRSRSVGCGSRSFSGDFFERISTGFGDCTLRRVESQREGKTRGQRHSSSMKERVKCGGIFGGFMTITSSSSSSSSSSYWVSSSSTALVHSRSRSWAWAFASPMRAFNNKSSSKDGKTTTTKNARANLSAVPSMLAVRS